MVYILLTAVKVQNLSVYNKALVELIIFSFLKIPFLYCLTPPAAVIIISSLNRKILVVVVNISQADGMRKSCALAVMIARLDKRNGFTGKCAIGK